MSSIFEGRKPAAALKFFEEISAIPRGSKNEQGIARYLEAFAKDRGLDVTVDSIWNVIIKKPGQNGGQNAPALILQGHTDIVCEKNSGTDFDFDREGLKLRVDGDILTADGTTLGNDDGYAVAYMMSILDDKSIMHPPLECLFTSQEEIGLIGAQQLDAGSLQARRMIGLDGGREGVFMVSSAGGTKVNLFAPAKLEPCERAGISIAVRGLQGGHSGGQIDKERGNANQILGRILHEIAKETEIRLSEVSGGMKDNAIPRESDCIIALDGDCVEKAIEIVNNIGREIQNELAHSDPGLRIEAARVRVTKQLRENDSRRALALQHLIHTGVIMMSKAVEGLVNASNNFAVVRRTGDELEYVVSVRSAEDSLCRAVTDRVIHLAVALGARAVKGASYPAYPYIQDSPLRDMATALYKERTGKDALIRAVHGGTECGVLRAKIPGLDIISTGPDSGEAHTPDEWLDLNSFARVYDFLLALIAKMCE